MRSDRGKTNRKKKRVKKILTGVLIAIIVLVSIYCFLIFSQNVTVKKWRDLYIETAMSTRTHQWLATYFIPKYIVDDVVKRKEEQLLGNIIGESNIIDNIRGKDYINIKTDPGWEYKNLYREIDFSTAPKTLAKNLNKTIYGEGKIKTVKGDDVYLVDHKNNILIIELKNRNFKGKLAIVKDSGQVKLAVNRNTKRGSTVNEMVSQYGAILGINGSGFIDPNWSSNGLNPAGLVLANGVVYKANAKNPYFQTVGFDWKDNLVMGKLISNANLRDAVEFKPILVLNGKAAVEGSLGLGIQPRTVIGQNINKEAMLLMIEGRMPGYSIGATMGELAEILMEYDCYNAMNMDGGSSSVMVYNGKEITKNCTGYTQGRTIPTAWIVMKAKKTLIKKPKKSSEIRILKNTES